MARAGPVTVPEPRTTVRLCGALSLEIDGRDLAGAAPGGQAGSLLRFLLAHREQPADREQLIHVLWPERPPSDPHGQLRPILSRLRRALAPAALEGRERLQLVLPEPVRVDVEEAAEAIGRTRAAATAGRWAEAREQAEAAVGLLRPGFLPDEPADWAAERRRRVEELELEALEWLARSSLALGGAELGGAERAGRELIARSPYRETGYRFLMEALAEGGNVAEALRVYDDLRVLLREELGAAPAADVQALHRRLLGGESLAAAPAADQPPERVPLPALLSRVDAPFVGRERELGMLRAAWQDARAGACRLAVVIGEPGIGKTRLTSEFAREAHEHGTVLYAGCQEEALLSYQPFVEALRHYARSTGLDAADVPPGAGAAELARLIPELAAPAAGAEEPATADPETRRYLLFEAIAHVLRAAAARSPLLLVLDDLQWANRATLQLLRHVLRSAQDAPLLVLGTYRAAEVGGEHPLAELLADLRRERLVERVSLAGLDERGVGALIVSHAGNEASSGLVETVHGRTAGNPFFVEEVMRHLIETGVLVERGGRWESARMLDEIGVPDGVKEVLARRLGRLGEESRQALHHGAVLGREFSFDVLAAMGDGDEDALIAALEEAVAAQLVVEVQRDLGPAYAFTHALVRETLYGALGGPRRQRLHARAAAAIEATRGESQLAALAVHHRLAGPAGDAAKALEYSFRAGDAAREVSAWEEAAVHWDGALAVLTATGGHPGARAQLLVALADLMVVAGNPERQIAYLEQALELEQALGDEKRAARTHSRLGMAHSLIDLIEAEHLDIPRAFEHFDAARRVIAAGPPGRALGHLETGISVAWSYGLQVDRGLEAAERAMEIADRVGDDALWTGAAEAYGWHALVAGRLAEGLAALERAFELADERHRPFLAWMALNIRGQLTWGLGAPDEAERAFAHQKRLSYLGKTSYRHQLADGLGRCHASRGEYAEARLYLPDARPAWITHSLQPLVDLWDGRWDRVVTLARRVLETSRRSGNRWDEWASRHLEARVRYLRGELEPAGELLEQALEIVVDGAAPYFELWVRPDLAHVRAESGETEAARAHVERCRGLLLGDEDWRGRVGHVTLADAVVLAGEDRLDEADAAFAAACATFREYRLRGDEAEALHRWGAALGAAEKLDEARELYRGCGAGDVWLERVERDRPGAAAGRARR